MTRAANIISYKHISENRSALMGIAMLSVMILHSLSWAQIEPTGGMSIVRTCCSFLFTDAFLFLSGYGLAHSLSKDANIKTFYKRRFQRIVIPFMIMALPFYVYSDLLFNFDLWKFVLDETSLFNFVYQNNGMWYIAASFLMYALAPFIYTILARSINKHYACMALALPFIAIALCIYVYLPDYSGGTSIIWDKLWMFVLGLFIGYQTINDKIGGVKCCYSVF